MKIKAEVKRKRKGGSDSDSDYVDEETLRRVLKKLKKIKTEYFDEESGLKSNKKGEKKEKKLTPEEAVHEECLREFPTLRARSSPSSLFSAIREARIDMWSFLSEIGFSSFHNVSIDKIPSRLGRYALSKFSSTTYKLTFETGNYVEVTLSKIHDILGILVGGISLFSLDVRPIEHEFVRSWVDQFYPKSLKEIRVGDIASKVISTQQVDFLFKVNFITLFTNTMGRVAGLKGQICLDVVRRLREESVISKIDWCGYIHSCLEDSELPEKPTLHYLGPFTFLIALFKKAEEKLATICSKRVVLEDLMRKASSDYPDGGNDSDGDDDGDDDNDDENRNNDEELNDDNDDGNGNNDEELNVDNDDGNGNNDEELNDEDTLGRNPSFGFSKIGLDDFEKQPSQEGTDGDLFGDNFVRMEVSNQGPPTPDRMPTRASNASANLGKRIVKPSSYLLSPYMNKKTKVVPRITRLEFSIGNSLFAMQGDKM
ncbi:hypothetical protein Tco_0612929 [Tanacetum coccineum]